MRIWLFEGGINEAISSETTTFTDRLLLTAAEDKISVTKSALLGYAWRYIVKRSFLEATGLTFKPGQLIEDIPFTLAAVQAAAKIVTVPGATYYYMRRAGSSLNSRDGKVRRKVAHDLSLAVAFRREFMAANGLGAVVRVVRTVQYKVLGIPMAKRIYLNNGKAKLYIFGLRFLQTKDVWV